MRARQRLASSNELLTTGIVLRANSLLVRWSPQSIGPAPGIANAVFVSTGGVGCATRTQFCSLAIDRYFYPAFHYEEQFIAGMVMRWMWSASGRQNCLVYLKGN